MKKTGSLFFGLVFSSLAFGNNFSDVWNQSAYGDFVNSENKKIALNLGFGNYQNEIETTSTKSLQITNSSFVLVGAKLNRAKLQIAFPTSSSDEERLKKGNTHFNVYSASFDWNNNLTLVADYYKIKGYYYETQIENSSVISQLSELSNKEFNLTAFYTFNDEHTSFAVENQLYEKRNDSGSWIWVNKIKNVNLNGLSELNGVADLNINSQISSAEVYLLDSSIGYSKNLFWKYGFIGGAMGLGLNAGKVSTSHIDGTNKQKTQVSTSYFASGSTGFLVNDFKIAFFANLNSSYVDIDDLNIGVRNGSAGIYVGYIF